MLLKFKLSRRPRFAGFMITTSTLCCVHASVKSSADEAVANTCKLGFGESK